MAKKQKTGGRKAGTPNRVTASVKAALEDAFERLGGVDALVEWAKDDPGGFYALYAKLLPIQVNGKFNHAGNVSIVVETGIARSPNDT